MSVFDEVVERRGTSSVKWDKYKDTDILPMWVADMDFRSPPQVVKALQERASSGVFGYTQPPEELIEVFLDYLKRSYGFIAESDDLVFIPGVVPSLNIACRGLVEPGESIVTATPVYYPFLEAPENFGHDLIRVPVEDASGVYTYPLDGLERALRSNSRLLLLCNPFNPLGRVLSEPELAGIIDICLRHGLTICSDEIHSDLVFDARRHLPTATVNTDIEEHLVTLMSPGKTYNLAGIGGSVAIIKSPELRARFVAAADGITSHVHLFSFAAMLAAYRDCDSWYRELIPYLEGNRDYLKERIEAMPGLSMNQVEATYLAWLDVRELGLEDPSAFFESAGIGMSDGSLFDGPGFMRLNFGCPRIMLELALDRIEHAVRGHL